MNCRGGPKGTSSQAAPNGESGANRTPAPPPNPSQAGPLVEIQERLPQVLRIASPNASQQNLEFRALSDRVVEESGANQLWISRVLRERGNG
ncbi:unnamed protein product [Tuber melanosporum]|uniref:(Perigord truffle) hypothetical protein n=1 Tax=Tuber melanosporum (strain Mel28) TaxID=656061 RepID=D5GHX0_TUBMM|nr:uncharacterized protein GSTUM_00008156001 [Tuber melanosporum]CAZ84113.1 unnamed protein product [Tuber melanosporum]